MSLIHHLRERLDRMAVSSQLYGAFASLIVLTAVVGAVALTGVNRVDTEAHTLASKWLAGVGHLAEARTQSRESRDYEVKFSRTDDKSYHSEYAEKMVEANKAINAGIAAYEALVASDAERDMFGKLKKSWGEYSAAQTKVIALGKDKKQMDAADFSDGAASMAFDEVQGAVAALVKFGFDGGDAAAAQADAVAVKVKWLIIGLLSAAMLLGAAMAWGLTRRLLGQLGGEPRDAVRVARAVAEGDLTTTYALRSGDTSSLMAVLQTMQHSLAETVTHVRQGSESVATASIEIAQGNQDLSSRTEQQASALQQTAATMDELGSTVRNNSDNARQANQLALGASTVAQQGGAVVGKVVETMKGINDSSKKSADIISVIDGLAFQTNSLALTAAVEAARAGEQGRGFAVVASEVRSLAQRSAQAAKEIKGLIGASVERVNQGTALVDQAGKTMTEIVGAIQRVTDIVGEISSASEEQSAGVGQVGQAITQMDQTTQQNAALVEQMAAAASSLKTQAGEMVGAVAVFSLPDDVVRVAAKAPRPVPR
ncbi:MAG: methyl-accepting chemotaxis protein, partial [Rubrivivax sp.]|nr:methyl-accepting chemotaxis protein [Rubrivivax sp.]